VEYLEDTVGWAIGLMQLATVVFLLWRPARKYAFVLVYYLLQLGTSVLEVLVSRTFGPRSRVYSRVFWTDEIVLDLLLFLILILLTHRAMEGSAARGAMEKMLAAVAMIVISLPFVLYQGAFVKAAWFDHTSQLLNFGAAILNLGLWTALLGSRKKDRQLLAVSAGFGVAATGVAISYGLRAMIHARGPAYTAANLTFELAHLAGAMILCWAFRPVRPIDNRPQAASLPNMCAPEAHSKERLRVL
jgi:hypothetical protein